MNRLPEQLVAWHNRNPLARRIRVDDVHTIGVVALPFMRSGRAAIGMPALPPQMIEPALADTADPVWSGESTLMPEAQATAAAPALASAGPTPATSLPRWKFWLRARAGKDSWPAFSERFIEGLAVSRIGTFTRRHGFAERPGPAEWPTREVAIDDQLVAPSDATSGVWPVELYLLSAAIDAGNGRTRVLIGQGAAGDSLVVLGRRCLSPVRSGVLALGLVLLAGGAAAALWWPRGPASSEPAASAPSAASAASAASATPAEAASAAPAETAASAPEAAAAAESVASAASAASAASTTAPAASSSDAAKGAAEPAPQASEPVRDIRPHLVQRVYPPRANEPTRAMLAPADKAPAAEKATAAKPDKTPGKPMAGPGSAAPGGATGKPTGPVVALVGPPSASKVEAEASLEKLRAAITGTMGKGGGSLQAAVFQTPEGWRAAVWPFASREEAQLINATLVARGMKTRAVDF
jgi:hypothetical protein